MSLPVSLTVVVGLDASTLTQWRLSLPTIAANRPQLRLVPWVIFYDVSQITSDDITEVAEANGLDRSPHVRLVPWPPDECDNEYPSQRARMLSGFVHVPANHIETPWFIKIDTDVIAAEHKYWILDEWFIGDHVLVASPWGYTKVKGDDRTASEWAIALEQFGRACWPGTPRLNLVSYVRGKDKIIHKRFWSPVSYYRTEWAADVSMKCEQYSGSCQLPVPSQDTVHWYSAERSGATYKRVNMKKHGWVFCSGLKAVKQKAREALTVTAL